MQKPVREQERQRENLEENKELINNYAQEEQTGLSQSAIKKIIKCGTCNRKIYIITTIYKHLK